MNSACMLFFFAQCSNKSIISTCDGFQVGDAKLERFLAKNQHTQRDFMKFENLCNDELSKIGHHFTNTYVM